MSSRNQKEKRLRPRNNPYKRNKFDQTKYIKQPKEQKSETNNEVFFQQEEEDDELEQEEQLIFEND